MSKFRPVYYCPYGNLIQYLYWNQKYCTCAICVDSKSLGWDKEDRHLYDRNLDYQIFKTQEEWDRRTPLYGANDGDYPHGIMDCEGKHLETINVDGKIKCKKCAIDINDDKFKEKR